MPARLILPVLSVAAILACVNRGGNDETLTPVVRPVPRTPAYTVTSVAGTQVAAFAVDSWDSGWSLRYLGASDSAGVLAYQAVRQTAPARRLPLIAGTQMLYNPAFLNECGCVTGVFPYHNAISSSENEFGYAPALTRQVLPTPREYVPFDVLQYVVFVSSTDHLTDSQWEAVTDSLGMLSTLTSAPARLGRLAFGRNPSARWMVTVRHLALTPTRDTSDVVPAPWSTLRWTARLPGKPR